MTITRRDLLKGTGAAAAVGPAPMLPPMLAPMLALAGGRGYDLQPVPVANGLWMIEGSTDYFSKANGGAIVNCALIDTADGLVIVDTGSSRRYGEALIDLARGLNGRGVAAVVNTHHHPDHFFGNQVFTDKPIHALGETRQLAAADGDGFADSMYRLLGDWMLGTEPVPPNTDILTSVLAIGGRRLQVLPLSGHTGADLALLDQDTGTLITGDLTFFNRAPTTPHADLSAWRDSLDRLEAIEAAAILPGHGPLDRTGASIAQTRAYLDWLETILKSSAAQGLDMVEIMALDLPSGFADMGAMPEEFHRSVSHLYPRIERAAMPQAN